MGAAGAIETVITICSLRDGVVPFTAGLQQPEAAGTADFVMERPRAVTAPYALTNSFGFGGNNAACVIARPEVAP
jgi:3-oxoacyl-(acyl-carrier-protein) synthase